MAWAPSSPGQGQDQSELVAAQTSDRVGLAHMGGEQARDMLQGGVAGGMAMGVVDGLETVEVYVDQGRRRLVPLGEGEGLGDLAQEGTPVEHRKQRIVIGQGFKLAHPAAQAFGFLAELVDFAHQGQQGTLDVRRQFGFRNAHDGCRIARRGGAARGIALAARFGLSRAGHTACGVQRADAHAAIHSCSNASKAGQVWLRNSQASKEMPCDARRLDLHGAKVKVPRFLFSALEAS